MTWYTSMSHQAYKGIETDAIEWMLWKALAMYNASKLLLANLR